MISRRLCIAMLVFGAFLIPQRAFPAEKWPDPVDEYVAQLRKTIGTVDMDGFLQVVKNPNGIRLVDVREPSEFAPYEDIAQGRREIPQLVPRIQCIC